MKKVLTILALTTVTCFYANAQSAKTSSSSTEKGTTLSFGAEFGLPTGDLNTTHKMGFGVSAKAAFPVTTGGDITASVGYVSFSGKTITVFGTSIPYPAWNMIPVKAGFSYRISGSNINFEPQIGYTFGTMSGATSSDVSGFTWAFGMGYAVTPAVDLGLRYESVSVSGGNANFIGLRLAYNINLSGK